MTFLNGKNVPLLRFPANAEQLNVHFPKLSHPLHIDGTPHPSRGYWGCFDEFFQYDFLLWGAIGLLFPEEDLAATGEQKYRWAFWCRDDKTIVSGLTKYINVLDRAHVEDLLLLGQIAERRVRAGQEHSVLLVGHEVNVSSPSVISASWGDTIEKFLSDPTSDDPRRFLAYQSVVRDVTPTPDNMCVCYVPGLILTESGDSALVGGLIWCCPKDAVQTMLNTLNTLLNTRAFSKQVLELYGLFRRLVVQLPPLQQLEKCLAQGLEGHWYTTDRKTTPEVLHTPNEQQQRRVRALLPRPFQSLATEPLNMGMKALLLVEQYMIVDPFLEAMLKTANWPGQPEFYPSKRDDIGFSFKGLFGTDRDRAVEFTLGLLNVLSLIGRDKQSKESLADKVVVTHLDNLDVRLSVKLKPSALKLKNVAAPALDPDVTLGSGKDLTSAFRRMVMSKDGGLRLYVFLSPESCSAMDPKTPPCAPDNRATLLVKDDELVFYFPPIT
ncbi:MAG: hypothetical protein WCB27_04685 [Thermoguttaceae bacterium]